MVCVLLLLICAMGYLLAMGFGICFVECSGFEFACLVLGFVVWVVVWLISLRFCWVCFVGLVGWGVGFAGCALYLALLAYWFLLFAG